MFKTSLSRYYIIASAFRECRPLDAIPNLLRFASIEVKIPSHKFHTCRINASSKDQVKESDDSSAPAKRVPCPDGAKLLRVALVGNPNAGKSTLINTLMETEVCPASTRPHTTRKPQRAIYLQEDTQIVFIDTPGVVNQKEVHKFNFTREFVLGPRKSIKNAHVVAVMHDVSHRLLRNKLDKKLITLLNNYPEKPAVLILNKVDLIISKRKLLDVLALLTNSIIGGKPIPIQQEEVRTDSNKMNTDDILERAAEKQRQKMVGPEPSGFTGRSGSSSAVQFISEYEKNFEDESTNDDDPDSRGWPNFQEVFMMSSLTGEGVESFKDYLIKQAKLASWDYPEEVLTNFSPQDIALLTLKSKILDNCEKDIPYKMTPVLEIWEESDRDGECVTIVFGIHCETPRVKKALLGIRGSTITSITHETERSLMKLLRRNVSLHIKAKCPEE